MLDRQGQGPEVNVEEVRDPRSTLRRVRQVLTITTSLAAAGMITAAHGERRYFEAEREASSVSIYHGQGVDEDLLDLPGVLFGGSVEWDDSYFFALGYQHGTRTPKLISVPLEWMHLDPVTTAVEVLAVKHRGLQSNFEADVAYAIHSPFAQLGPLRVRFGFSVGLSYAFGTPSYEDGSVDDPEKRYHFQNYNAYELEWGSWRYPRFSLVTRVHHRSGIYGLIAPRRVGSNFLTAGLRLSW